MLIPPNACPCARKEAARVLQKVKDWTDENSPTSVSESDAAGALKAAIQHLHYYLQELDCEITRQNKEKEIQEGLDQVRKAILPVVKAVRAKREELFISGGTFHCLVCGEDLPGDQLGKMSITSDTITSDTIYVCTLCMSMEADWLTMKLGEKVYG